MNKSMSKLAVKVLRDRGVYSFHLIPQQSNLTLYYGQDEGIHAPNLIMIKGDHPFWNTILKKVTYKSLSKLTIKLLRDGVDQTFHWTPQAPLPLYYDQDEQI